MEDEPANRHRSPFGCVSYAFRLLSRAAKVHRGSGSLAIDPQGMEYRDSFQSRKQFVIKLMVRKIRHSFSRRFFSISDLLRAFEEYCVMRAECCVPQSTAQLSVSEASLYPVALLGQSWTGRTFTPRPH